MLVSATALLAANPRPTEDEVRIGLSGNLCRCTGYDGIVKAVLSVGRRRASEPASSGIGVGRDPRDDRRIGTIRAILSRTKEDSHMTKTSLSIDREKADAAAAVLGTSTLTATIDAALTEIVNMDRRRRLGRAHRSADGRGIGPTDAELRRLRTP